MAKTLNDLPLTLRVFLKDALASKQITQSGLDNMLRDESIMQRWVGSVRPDLVRQIGGAAPPAAAPEDPWVGISKRFEAMDFSGLPSGVKGFLHDQLTGGHVTIGGVENLLGDAPRLAEFLRGKGRHSLATGVDKVQPPAPAPAAPAEPVAEAAGPHPKTETAINALKTQLLGAGVKDVDKVVAEMASSGALQNALVKEGGHITRTVRGLIGNDQAAIKEKYGVQAPAAQPDLSTAGAVSQQAGDPRLNAALALKKLTDDANAAGTQPDYNEVLRLTKQANTGAVDQPTAQPDLSTAGAVSRQAGDPKLNATMALAKLHADSKASGQPIDVAEMRRLQKQITTGVVEPHVQAAVDPMNLKANQPSDQAFLARISKEQDERLAGPVDPGFAAPGQSVGGATGQPPPGADPNAWKAAVDAYQDPNAGGLAGFLAHRKAVSDQGQQGPPGGQPPGGQPPGGQPPGGQQGGQQGQVGGQQGGPPVGQPPGVQQGQPAGANQQNTQGSPTGGTGALDVVNVNQATQAGNVTDQANQVRLGQQQGAIGQTPSDVSPFINALKPLQDSIANLSKDPALNLGFGNMQQQQAGGTAALTKGFQDTLAQVNQPLVDQLNTQRSATETFRNDFQARQAAQDAVRGLEAQQEQARNAELDIQLENLLRNRQMQFDEQGNPIDDAITQANLAQLGRQEEKSREQLATQLQALGVLRNAGQPIDTFGELTGQFDVAEAAARAEGQQRGERAFADSLRLLESRRADRSLDDTIRNRARQLGVSEGQLSLGALGEFGRTARHGQDVALKGALGFGELLGDVGGQDTLARDKLDLARGQALGRIDGQDTLARGQALGRIDGQDTLARDQLDLTQRFGEADRSGLLDGTRTLAGLARDDAERERVRRFGLDQENVRGTLDLGQQRVDLAGDQLGLDTEIRRGGLLDQQRRTDLMYGKQDFDEISSMVSGGLQGLQYLFPQGFDPSAQGPGNTLLRNLGVGGGGLSALSALKDIDGSPLFTGNQAENTVRGVKYLLSRGNSAEDIKAALKAGPGIEGANADKVIDVAGGGGGAGSFAQQAGKSLGYYSAGQAGDQLLQKFIPGKTGEVFGDIAAGAGTGAALGNLIPIPGVGPISGALVGGAVGGLSNLASRGNWSDPVDDFASGLPNKSQQEIFLLVSQLETLLQQNPGNRTLQRMLQTARSQIGMVGGGGVLPENA